MGGYLAKDKFKAECFFPGKRLITTYRTFESFIMVNSTEGGLIDFLCDVFVISLCA